MTHPLEQLEPDEAAMIAEMTRILRAKMARDYAKGATRRDAHPKTVGLLRGKFSIEPGLPPELRIGVFKTQRSFDCWVRVSNASGKIQSDAIRDARGIGIKLMQDGGRGKASDTPLGQDFVLLSAPSMPLGTVALFRDAVHYAIESSPLLLAGKLLLIGQPGVLLGLAGLLIAPSSPFDIRYWSTTPYRWGSHEVVKYALRPTSRYRSKRPSKPGES